MDLYRTPSKDKDIYTRSDEMDAKQEKRPADWNGLQDVSADALPFR
jgi:hypothetical protein